MRFVKGGLGYRWAANSAASDVVKRLGREERREEASKLYLCCVIVKDEDGGDMVGSAKLIFADSQAEAFHSAEESARSEFTPGSNLAVISQEITEVGNEMIERAAIEVLGWTRQEKEVS